MNLDSVVKYHFAKSTQINDSPRATASDTLTGTDVMAAMGMCQSRAPLGYSAFLGKMEISITEKKKGNSATNPIWHEALRQGGRLTKCAVKPRPSGRGGCQEVLITELHKAEEDANRQLTKVTSNFEKS